MAFCRKHVTQKGHPIAPVSGLILVSRLTLYNKLGGGPQTCHWCNRIVLWTDPTWTSQRANNRLVVDHVDNNPENDDVTNLVPACYGCNISRGRRPMEPGDPFISISGIRHRAAQKVCVSCGIKFLVPISQLKYRAGRFCSRGCRNTKCAAESERGIKPGEVTTMTYKAGGQLKRGRGVNLVCGWCESPFVAPKRFSATRRYCSESCAGFGRGKARREKTLAAKPQSTCPTCLKTFATTRYSTGRYKVCCSRACSVKLARPTPPALP